ncbi:trimethylguanosine synthase-like [Galendromus occidentalis]|uniref:Trimethylguanosine synthase n=1 Tax=Galendromus occidentalis TaxID=34638 RepID=A0AAJ7P9W8_9ACAR|nr:trimethylguanosine synthase-like [Galendromus occidentalis]
MLKTLEELKERREPELIAAEKFIKGEFESPVNEHQKRNVIARVSALDGPGETNVVEACSPIVYPAPLPGRTKILHIVPGGHVSARSVLSRLQDERIIPRGSASITAVSSSTFLVSTEHTGHFGVEIEGVRCLAHLLQYEPRHKGHRGSFAAGYANFLCGSERGPVYRVLLRAESDGTPVVVSRSYAADCESVFLKKPRENLRARFTRSGQSCCCEDQKLGTTVLRAEHLETSGLLFADKAARTNFTVSKAPCGICGVELAKETKFLSKMATAPARQVSSEDGMRKYFSQRFRLISRYHASLGLSQTAWFSVSPEEISKHIARRVIALSRRLGRKIRVFDPFCGAGGFIVQAAVMDEVSKVFASDINEYEVNSARRMARLYGVPEEKISFRVSNFFDLEENLFRSPIDAIICGPPWGGPSYSNGLFDLENMEPNFIKILRHCAKFTPNIALLMPKNMALDQIHQSARVAGLRGGVELELNFLAGREKTATLYYGDLINTCE